MTPLSRSRFDDEAGVSLVEVLVALVLLGIIGSALLTSMLTVHDAAGHVARRSSDQGYARTGISVLSRDVRVATVVPTSNEPAFRSANATSLEFTAALNSFDRPLLVQIAPDVNNQMVETATQPDSASEAPNLVYNSADAVVRYVARFLAPGQTTYFRYFDASDNELVPPASGSLDEAARRAIARVEIEFTIREDLTNPDRETTVRTGVRLPNPIG